MVRYRGEVALVARELGFSEATINQLGALWGKSASRGGGRWSLLICHLLDTAAVADEMWAHFMAPSIRVLLNDLAGGNGQRLFRWLCALHDCGKAVPAFQALDKAGAARVQRAGLSWNDVDFESLRWRHDVAGATLLRSLLSRSGSGWDASSIEWLWPLVAGHHGRFPSKKFFGCKQARGEHQGRCLGWGAVQEALVLTVTRILGYQTLAESAPRKAPNKAEQLMLSGLIVMADWIASASEYFPGIRRLDDVSWVGAQARAREAWKHLRLRGGWGSHTVSTGDLVAARFGNRARPFQRMVVDAATRMRTPGLMLIEAPMGEGKTKAALVTAEIMAAKFGADGVFVGMPTQATSDPMFGQVCAWLDALSAELAAQVALLHGKARFSPEFRKVRDGLAQRRPDEQFVDVGEDADGQHSARAECGDRFGPAEWFLGRLRGLLTGFAVGTIDQLLFAATRTRHVMLRFAGLAGKVVILDEVHAADIYMEQFLEEAVWWLGRMRAPVILLTATLSPRQKHTLVSAYLTGAGADDPSSGVPEPQGYPSVTIASVVDNRPEVKVDDAPSWRQPIPVQVEVLASAAAGTAAVVNRVRHEVQDGGTALVVHNTVNRAQETFRELKQHFGEDVRLLHGRLNAVHRAERTADCLRLLGAEQGRQTRATGTPRPRLVVVATQLAECSFDVDVDVLVTDLAPIDLLLQRIGRLHRHENIVRPSRLSAAKVIVTGLEPQTSTPRLLEPSVSIYGRHRLLRAAALVLSATDTGWSVPADVPRLVALGYGTAHLGPGSWSADEELAFMDWTQQQDDRAARAREFVLTRQGKYGTPTLAGLHEHDVPGRSNEERFEALVRDGEPSVEVVIVRRLSGGYYAWDGATPLGVNGEVLTGALDTVLGGVTRLPAKLSEQAESTLAPLSGWLDDPWLRRSRALVLDEHGQRKLGGSTVRYDDAEGLIVT